MILEQAVSYKSTVVNSSMIEEFFLQQIHIKLVDFDSFPLHTYILVSNALDSHFGPLIA